MSLLNMNAGKYSNEKGCVDGSSGIVCVRRGGISSLAVSGLPLLRDILTCPGTIKEVISLSIYFDRNIDSGSVSTSEDIASVLGMCSSGSTALSLPLSRRWMEESWTDIDSSG